MPLPTSVADRRPCGSGGQAELGEQRVHRRGEVVDRVEQRAVEVERDRVDARSARAGAPALTHAAASSARICAIVAA